MIVHGVLASMMVTPPAISGGDPIAVADFANGVYSVGATSLTAADVVSDTGRISASGLSILPGYGNKVDLLGAFRDVLLTANWTIVFETDVLAPEPLPGSQFNNLLYMYDFDDDGFVNVLTWANEGSYWEQWISVEREIDISHGGTGLNRHAVTRTDVYAAISTNGSVAETDTTAITALDYIAAETAWHTKSNPAGHIRSITIYAVQDNADLPVLSALP